MRVLVVEDEAALARQLVQALGAAGYAVDGASDGVRAEFLGATESYAAVVLDLGLPGMDGLTLLRRWRESGVTAPVLVLTARGSWHEKVVAIDSGADDYVTKPFQIEEVLARLRALLRRAGGQAEPALHCGAIVLEPRASRVTLGGTPVHLDEPRAARPLVPHAPARPRRPAERASRARLHARRRPRPRTPSKCSSRDCARSSARARS